MPKGKSGFQKGHKGFRYFRTPEGVESIKLANTGENNMGWKGDKVGMSALHEWVRNRLPQPDLCQDCKLVPPRDLANISQKYLRELTDWEYLCRRCHMTKDGRIEKSKLFIKEHRKGVPKAQWKKKKLVVKIPKVIVEKIKVKKVYNKEKNSIAMKKNRVRKTGLIFKIMGDKCVSCGNSDKRVLLFTLKSGAIGKKNLGNADEKYLYIRDNEIEAKSKYEFLCSNCNLIKRFENR